MSIATILLFAVMLATGLAKLRQKCRETTETMDAERRFYATCKARWPDRR